MATFTWNKDMAVGVAVIDEQHQRLVELVNEFYYAFMDGKDKEVLDEVIERCNHYADMHFATEEEYMDAYKDSYPGYAEHLKLHRQFEERVVDGMLRFVRGDEDLSAEFLDFLTDWWFKHINGVDKKFGAFLNSQGVS